MAKKRYIPETIIRKLREAEVLQGQGQTIAQVALLVVSLPGPGSSDISSLPGVLCTTKDSIGVRYHTAEPNDRHDEAMQFIAEHCVDGFVETKRVEEYTDSRTVYAKCLRADGSPAVSQPCEFDADEQVGFGEEY